MTVMVTSFQSCEVGEWGDEIAKVNDAGTVVIHPQGYGLGASITMSVEDWARISQQVENQIRLYQARQRV